METSSLFTYVLLWGGNVDVFNGRGIWRICSTPPPCVVAVSNSWRRTPHCSDWRLLTSTEPHILPALLLKFDILAREVGCYTECSSFSRLKASVRSREFCLRAKNLPFLQSLVHTLLTWTSSTPLPCTDSLFNQSCRINYMDVPYWLAFRSYLLAVTAANNKFRLEES
jgi:hypothetical protein